MLFTTATINDNNCNTSAVKTLQGKFKTFEHQLKYTSYRGGLMV